VVDKIVVEDEQIAIKHLIPLSDVQLQRYHSVDKNHIKCSEIPTLGAPEQRMALADKAASSFGCEGSKRSSGSPRTTYGSGGQGSLIIWFQWYDRC
jgi:hypothetical protein